MTDTNRSVQTEIDSALPGLVKGEAIAERWPGVLILLSFIVALSSPTGCHGLNALAITESAIDANRGGTASHAAVRRFLDSLKLLP